MGGGERQGRNGGSGGSTCRQNDALGRWWEMVQLCGILFHLALGCDDGAGRFCGVQPGRYISQDARETYVVLWSQIGWPGDVDVCPTMELDARAP